MVGPLPMRGWGLEDTEMKKMIAWAQIYLQKYQSQPIPYPVIQGISLGLRHLLAVSGLRARVKKPSLGSILLV
jgi:hypothetical protein